MGNIAEDLASIFISLRTNSFCCIHWRKNSK